MNPPSGCRFHTRCLYKKADCERVEPELKDIGGSHYVACHYWQEVQAKRLGTT
ncbi:MAG: oligopeptide/dipeptide ABC transporter ATP-binding protein [Candidatus Entotheonellia bacterium]